MHFSEEELILHSRTPVLETLSPPSTVNHSIFMDQSLSARSSTCCGPGERFPTEYHAFIKMDGKVNRSSGPIMEQDHTDNFLHENFVDDWIADCDRGMIEVELHSPKGKMNSRDCVRDTSCAGDSHRLEADDGAHAHHSQLGVQMRGALDGKLTDHEKVAYGDLQEHESYSPGCPVIEKEVEHVEWEDTGYELGKGSFGRCFVARDKGTGSLMAAKEQVISEKLTLAEIEAERDILEKCDHPNILPFIMDDQRGKNHYIFTELMEGGSLEKVIQQDGWSCPNDLIFQYTRCILNGLDYIHDRNMLHRDIKPANILLDGWYDQAVLADFGLARSPEEGMDYTAARTLQGTCIYMAPETAKNHQHRKASDIWSLGCVIFEMATKQRLWNISGDLACIYKIGSLKTGELPGRLASGDHPPISADMYSIIKRCLRVDPEDRPDAKTLLDMIPCYPVEPQDNIDVMDAVSMRPQGEVHSLGDVAPCPPVCDAVTCLSGVVPGEDGPNLQNFDVDYVSDYPEDDYVC